MGLENERKQLQKKLEQLEALLFVTFTFVEENRRNISSIRERLRSFTKTELKQAIGATDAFLKKMSDKFGLKSPLGEIVRFYKEIKAGIESGHVVYSGRWQCLQDFSKAHEIFCE